MPRVAETYDVIWNPNDRAYTIFAQSMDRSDMPRNASPARHGADVPPLDPKPGCDADMGMDT